MLPGFLPSLASGEGRNIKPAKRSPEPGSLLPLRIALPQGDSAVVVAMNSTVTDAIPDIFGGLARAIGERRALQALESYFEGIRRGAAGR